MTSRPPIQFDNQYAALPERFFAAQSPTPVAAPGLIAINTPLAESLDIDTQWLQSPQGLEVLAGNQIAEGSTPLSAAYAGHQFGGWNPQLGDGRAILLGEVVDGEKHRYDIQLKGSGPTPWSRGGDGRSPIGPVLREYIVSEAMAALGVPTTRALAAVTTGEQVMRDRAMPGAILTRVAASHIRIGTFQYFAARKDTEALTLLADHVIERHYPAAASSENPYLALLEHIVSATAKLIARWQLLGFIHGVMNTDNMLVSGETIDYGPCAFMDEFHPETVFSSIDSGGRYAYRNQPAIAHWNLANLAQTLLPLLHSNEDAAVTAAQSAVDAFPDLFLAYHQSGMNQKLGLTQEQDGDATLIEDLFAIMMEQHSDFTLTFRRLSDIADAPDSQNATVESLVELGEAFSPWLDRWHSRLKREAASPAQRANSMRMANPVFIPRNHLVEAVIQAAVNEDDLAPFHELSNVLGQPHVYRPSWAIYATPPKADQIVKQTFCGT